MKPSPPIYLLWISRGMPVWYLVREVPLERYAGTVASEPRFMDMKGGPNWVIRLEGMDRAYQRAHGGAKTILRASALALTYRDPQPKKAKPKRRR